MHVLVGFLSHITALLITVFMFVKNKIIIVDFHSLRDAPSSQRARSKTTLRTLKRSERLTDSQRNILILSPGLARH